MPAALDLRAAGHVGTLSASPTITPGGADRWGKSNRARHRQPSKDDNNGVRRNGRPAAETHATSRVIRSAWLRTETGVDTAAELMANAQRQTSRGDSHHSSAIAFEAVDPLYFGSETDAVDHSSAEWVRIADDNESIMAK